MLVLLLEKSTDNAVLSAISISDIISILDTCSTEISPTKPEVSKLILRVLGKVMLSL